MQVNLQDFHLEAKLFSNSADCILVSREAHLTIQDDTFQGDANGGDFQPSLGGAPLCTELRWFLICVHGRSLMPRYPY